MLSTRPDALTYLKPKVNDLGPILVYDLKKLCWPVLLIPPIVFAVIAVLLNSGRVDWTLDSWELASPILLGCAAVVALIRMGMSRRPYFAWLSVLMVLLFYRELHWMGSNLIVHVGIVVLMTLAWLEYRRFGDYFASRWVITLLVTMFFCYTISQMLDQRWLKWLPDEKVWEKRTEEPMEALGHCFALLLALLSRKAPEGATPFTHSAK
ncbi:MAG: hypothetical protein JXM70_24815 [Pirellulales bacterium]|nr:hypothetical protein [Pirellulales bacterium]